MVALFLVPRPCTFWNFVWKIGFVPFVSLSTVPSAIINGREAAATRRVATYICDRCTYQFVHISLSSISSMMMQMVALLCVKWGKFELILTGPTNLLVGLAFCQPGLPH